RVTGRPSESTKSISAVMMSQETNLGRQTSREEVEPKVNKRRKQGLDIVTTVNNTNNTTIQNIFQEYNTTVNDQNSRFELTPKNLAMMSSESVEVNNTEKEMDPIQITSMDIDSDGSKPHTDLEMSLEIDNTTEPIRDPWVEEKKDKLESA
ncbi:19694_t:CDS:1, partial [Gigaspora rosea]